MAKGLDGCNGLSALDVAINAAREAGEVIVQGLVADKDVKHKGRGNLLTKIDLASEKLIIDTLKKEFPHFGFLSEESYNEISTTEFTWVIDPLDGTNNFVFNVPFFCVSIALTRGQDILLGVIYDPVREELFVTEKGKGFTVNGMAAHVSGVTELSAGLIALDTGYDYERNRELMAHAVRLRENSHCMRILGSAALGLAYVACGRYTAYLHRFMYPWDIAAGLLMVEEAGGKATDWGNAPVTFNSDQIIATNGRVHDELLRLVSI